MAYKLLQKEKLNCIGDDIIGDDIIAKDLFFY